MRDLKISYGNSRQAKFWSNKTITFDELCSRLKEPIRTTETAEEYPKLPKKQRDEIKDKGGFVAGHLKDNRRQRDKVACRSMLVYDLDSMTPEFVSDIQNRIKNKGVCYSTHSHTPSAPRERLIIPVTRDMTPDEFNAVARYYAADNKLLEMIDPCSFSPHQLMYWPTCPSNGEYLFDKIDGPCLDPDEVLAKHPEWKDLSLLPTTPKESKVHENTKHQKDPYEKNGIVGVFCRAFSIQEVMDTFLSDVYAPTANVSNRYDYIPGEGSAGVVVYEDKFAYSHHATDPAGGKLCNAFDLVRLHKFGDEGDSFQQMSDFAISLDKVKALSVQERVASANKDFSDDDDWMKGLEISRKGVIADSLDNLVLILRHDPELSSIAFNCHRDGIDAKGELPWEQIKNGWNDSDYASMKVYLSNKYGIYAPTKTKDAVLAVAAERAYHPIKEYLENLPEWDKVPRVDTLFVDYFGAEDTSYTRAVSRKSMAAAVARIYAPGVKFDSVPILYGPQGIGKSTFYAKLAGDWFSDSLTLTDMKDKSGPEKLQGYWILELGELAGMRKTDVETVKSFISRTDDKYRASYGVNVQSHPRQCIIVGSTNAENGFLRDITGNRRFWPVRVYGHARKHAWDMNPEEVKQIWAETLEIYRSGEKLFLEGEDSKKAANEQDAAMETDEREGLVRAYLDALLPDNWGSLGIFERRNYLNGGDFGAKPNGTVVREYVCNLEIWTECFGKDPAAIKPADSYAIAAIMKKIDSWEKAERRTYKNYGLQRGYKRKSDKS